MISFASGIRLDKIKKLVEYQRLYNREQEIRRKYAEEEKKMERLLADNAKLVARKNDLEMNIYATQKKLEDEQQKKAQIEQRIKDLDENKDKVKITRQIKAWEKEMETLQQDLNMIIHQIDYETKKQSDTLEELNQINASMAENDAKIKALRETIAAIEAEHRDELVFISETKKNIASEFDVSVIEYVDLLLEKTKGMAIVSVLDGDTCSGCYTILPTMIQGEIGPNLPVEEIELQQCPHCFRFLYYPEWLERDE
ncbi:MAG: hypothetical protein HPY78_09400 [Brevinematales bacterium]|jgi:predicted  nucleic acid-binding Zn-ribbon protein|nr:hypothetical protein [Brevinematales bacterium]